MYIIKHYAAVPNIQFIMKFIQILKVNVSNTEFSIQYFYKLAKLYVTRESICYPTRLILSYLKPYDTELKLHLPSHFFTIRCLPRKAGKTIYQNAEVFPEMHICVYSRNKTFEQIGSYVLLSIFSGCRREKSFYCCYKKLQLFYVK